MCTFLIRFRLLPGNETFNSKQAVSMSYFNEYLRRFYSYAIKYQLAFCGRLVTIISTVCNCDVQLK